MNIAISRPFSSFVFLFFRVLVVLSCVAFFSGPLVAQRDSPERAAHQLSRTLRPLRLFLAGKEFSVLKTDRRGSPKRAHP